MLIRDYELVTSLSPQVTHGNAATLEIFRKTHKGKHAADRDANR
jgi:hypothetical protein